MSAKYIPALYPEPELESKETDCEAITYEGRLLATWKAKTIQIYNDSLAKLHNYKIDSTSNK